MVFYRKYRPQKIDELDNTQVRETLLSLFAKSEKDSSLHAFLFTGPKGLGKTSAARIVAKVVNCVGRRKTDKQDLTTNTEEKSAVSSQQSEVESIEPCNGCEQCIAITKGTSLDVIEIDAASNRGIDEIRDLKEKIRLAPASAKKKIYIIDEVHMLTTEAFNALLKTLEEPPSHAMFILCTTEPHKVPATIVSRCFRSASLEELVRSLKRIAQGEKLKIDEEALQAVARLSEGGFRDGAKILEELSLLAKNEPLTKKFVQSAYNISHIADQTNAFLDSLSKRDVRESLSILLLVKEQGMDMKFFLQQVIESLHQSLLAKEGIVPSVLRETLLSTPDIIVLLKHLSQASVDMKSAVLPQLPLELAVIEWSLQERVDTPEPIVVETQPASKKLTLSSARKHVGNMAKQAILQPATSEKASTATDNPQAASYELLHYCANGEPTPEWVKSLWQGLIAKTKNHNHTVAGVLRGCHIASFEKGLLTIQTAYQFHKDKLEQAKVKDLLESICKELTGNQMQVAIKLKAK